MWQLLFRGLVLRVIVMSCVAVVLAFAVVVFTPVILVLALCLAQRRRVPFRVALGEVYGSIWDMFWQVIRAPFTHNV